MFNKAELIQSINETFFITSVIETDVICYTLFDINSQEHIIKKEEDVSSTFSKIETHQLTKEQYQILLTYFLKESKYFSLKHITYQKLCNHELVDENEEAKCVICNDSLGWFCEESPDKLCHYYTNKNGLIELNNQTQIAPPIDHNKKYETYDCCIFCGAPEERK